MDAFYVSVELLRRPELLGQPVVVGGDGNRGVVAAASYEARRYGIHSAMPSSRARRLCPHAVFLPADIGHYVEVGEQIVEILLRYTPLVEPISVDESFLDVTGSEKLFGDAVQIAWSIRKDIADECGLTCSVGIAPNKFLAKLASEHAKPKATSDSVQLGHQVFVVEPGTERDFLHPLPVSALWGVGPATKAKLERLGVHTVGQLAEFEEDLLCHSLGEAHGRHLFALAHAVDDRPVVPERYAKSIGNEETFAHDISTLDDLRPQLLRLCESVARRIRHNNVAARTLTVKIKFSSFHTVTRSTTLQRPLTTAPAMMEALWPLLCEIDPSSGVRLLGVHASKLVSEDEVSDQPSLFDEIDQSNVGEAQSPERIEEQWTQATHAVDGIIQKFGGDAIGPARTLGSRRPGESPYGPQGDIS